MKTVVLRQSCIYGTRQFGIEDQGWIAWFVIASILKKPINIYGDGMQVRDVLWVDDLVDAYVSLYNSSDMVSGKVLNIGGGHRNAMSILDLVARLKKVGLLEKRPALKNWRAGDQKVFITDIGKIQKIIKWQPKVSANDGIDSLIQWAKDNQSLLKKILS